MPLYCTRPGILDRFIRRLRYLHLRSGGAIADYTCAHGYIFTAGRFSRPGPGRATPLYSYIPPASPQRAQNCGTVNTALNGQPVDRNQARLAGNCFWQAFQHCQAATLLLREHSLDTGADHTFTIKSNNGKCSIVDTVKHYIVPNNQITTTTYSCSGLVMQADGLHFIACGNLGSIHLPL